MSKWLDEFTNKFIENYTFPNAKKPKRVPVFDPTSIKLHENGFRFSNQDYVERYDDQQGLCAICKKRFPKLHIDHDHTSGIVRGLLCRQCNIGLGNMKDSIKIIINAAKYLRKYKCFKVY